MSDAKSSEQCAMCNVQCAMCNVQCAMCNAVPAVGMMLMTGIVVFASMLTASTD